MRKRGKSFGDLIGFLNRKRNTSAAGSPGWSDCSHRFPEYIKDFCGKYNIDFGAVMIILGKKTKCFNNESGYSGVCYKVYSDCFLKTRLPQLEKL